VTLVRRLLVVVLSALAFCAAATAAATGDPQYQLVAADQTWADGIVLTSKDLGTDWQAYGNAGAMTGEGSGTSSGTCSEADESDLVLTGGTYSPDFYRKDGGAFVSATAIVWQTPEQAQADWDRHMQAGFLSCLAADAQGLGTKKVKVVVNGRKQLSWPINAQRSAVYRLALVFKANVKVRGKIRKVSAKATFDFIAVSSGRATAMLGAFSFNAQPLSDFNKQQLAMIMAQRLSVDPASAPSAP
jgi:hypothetical protein